MLYKNITLYLIEKLLLVKNAFFSLTFKGISKSLFLF